MASGGALATTAIRSRNGTPRAVASNAGDAGTGERRVMSAPRAGRLFETHEPCRSSAVTSRPKRAVVLRSRRCQWGKVPVEC